MTHLENFGQMWDEVNEYSYAEEGRRYVDYGPVKRAYLKQQPGASSNDFTPKVAHQFSLELINLARDLFPRDVVSAMMQEGYCPIAKDPLVPVRALDEADELTKLDPEETYRFLRWILHFFKAVIEDLKF